MNDLKKKLRESLARSGWEFDLPSDRESLRDLGLDSLAFALWIADVERTLGVKIPIARLTGGTIDTLEGLARLVEETERRKA